MRFRLPLFPVLLMWFAACFVCSVGAQTTEDGISARLVDKPLYLRGLWGYDKLKFDGTGQPEAKYLTAPFTVCGIDVSHVELRGDKLKIQGQRVALAFERDGTMRRIPLTIGRRGGDSDPERLTVEIHGFHGQDFGAVLDAVFADSLAPLVPLMPDFWQKYARAHFGAVPPAAERDATQPSAARVSSSSAGPAPVAAPAHIGGKISPPRVLHNAEADFNEEARQIKYSGNVQVYLWVDEQGLPSHISIAKPTGVGLDEKAVESVAKYRFKPAMRDGQPVKVDLYIEVNFQIF